VAQREQVVVFDDASQDATYELAVGIKTIADLPKLCVAETRAQSSIRVGTKAATAISSKKASDIVVLLHGDGQYAPEILSHLTPHRGR